MSDSELTLVCRDSIVGYNSEALPISSFSYTHYLKVLMSLCGHTNTTFSLDAHNSQKLMNLVKIPNF